jgi:hypothetical protein
MVGCRMRRSSLTGRSRFPFIPSTCARSRRSPAGTFPPGPLRVPLRAVAGERVRVGCCEPSNAGQGRLQNFLLSSRRSLTDRTGRDETKHTDRAGELFSIESASTWPSLQLRLVSVTFEDLLTGKQFSGARTLPYVVVIDKAAGNTSEGHDVAVLSCREQAFSKYRALTGIESNSCFSRPSHIARYFAAGVPSDIVFNFCAGYMQVDGRSTLRSLS